jgi:hypothetical protein
MEIHRFKKKYPKKKVKPVAKLSQVKTNDPKTAYYDEETYPLLKCLCTNPNAGQQKFGGWTDAALARYAELMKSNRDARKSQDSADLEK